MADRWKLYDPLERVAVYERGGGWPVDREVRVLANVGGTQLRTPARIMVDGVCAFDLTTAQLAAFRGALARAELDLGAPAPAIAATGSEGHCESCSQPVRAGERIVIEDEDTDDRVVLHAGQCPDDGSN